MKKIFSLALVFIMLFTMAVTVNAQTITESGSVEVTYSVAHSYTVTIPDSMTIGTPAEVSVTNVVIGADQGVAVTVSSTQYNAGWQLSDGTNTVGYTLQIAGKDIENNGEVLYTTAGEDATATLNTAVIKTPIYSGEFTDTLTFKVEIVDKDITKADADALIAQISEFTQSLDEDTLSDDLQADLMELKTTCWGESENFERFFVTNDGYYTQEDINNRYSSLLTKFNTFKAKVEAAS